MAFMPLTQFVAETNGKRRGAHTVMSIWYEGLCRHHDENYAPAENSARSEGSAHLYKNVIPRVFAEDVNDGALGLLVWASRIPDWGHWIFATAPTLNPGPGPKSRLEEADEHGTTEAKKFVSLLCYNIGKLMMSVKLEEPNERIPYINLKSNSPSTALAVELLNKSLARHPVALSWLSQKMPDMHFRPESWPQDFMERFRVILELVEAYARTLQENLAAPSADPNVLPPSADVLRDVMYSGQRDTDFYGHLRLRTINARVLARVFPLSSGRLYRACYARYHPLMATRNPVIMNELNYVVTQVPNGASVTPDMQTRLWTAILELQY